MAAGLTLIAGPATPDVPASCVASLKWASVDYSGMRPPGGGKLHLGRRIGRVPAEPCRDTPNAPQPEEEPPPHRLFRIKSVPPGVAVYDRQDGMVYAANGYFISLPSHPLHAVYGPGSFFPAGVSIRSCGRARTLRGRVTGGFNSIQIRTHQGRARRLEVTPRTRIRGFLRQGLPYLQAGDRVKAVAQACRLRLGARILVARRVAP